MFKILFKMHAILNFSGCFLKTQKLILNDTENVSNKNIHFRTSFLGRIQNFSWNWYFPTINIVLLNLYYLLANMFAADIFQLVLLSEVKKQIISGSFIHESGAASPLNKEKLKLWIAIIISLDLQCQVVLSLPRDWNVCLGLCLMSVKSNKIISSDCVEK